MCSECVNRNICYLPYDIHIHIEKRNIRALLSRRQSLARNHPRPCFARPFLYCSLTSEFAQFYSACLAHYPSFTLVPVPPQSLRLPASSIKLLHISLHFAALYLLEVNFNYVHAYSFYVNILCTMKFIHIHRATFV